MYSIGVMSLADVWENLRFVLSAAAVLALVAAVVVGPRWAARAPVALPTVFVVVPPGPVVAPPVARQQPPVVNRRFAEADRARRAKEGKHRGL